jgi:tripartite-type tricarboxylate transporter receptor subunit TctC
MRSNGSFVYRVGTIFLFIFLIVFSNGGCNESQAAQPEFWKPRKPLTIIVSSYGGANDWTARQLSRVLPDYLGQKVIVQGVMGAEGKNALDTLQGSKSDGHTMSLVGVGTYVGLSTKKSPYSWNVKDLTVLLAIDTPPYGVFVNPKSPYSNYQDIVKTKAAIRIALPGTNFAVVPLLADFDKKGIPYKFARFKGAAEANLAVIAGNADLTAGPLSGINAQPILAGDFRLLWLYDTKRLAMFPNVPTHVELGMPKEWSHYRVARLIQVPPGTPEHIQKALREALIKALRDKRTVEWSKTVDTPVGVLSELELKERINFLIKGFSENPNIVEAYF